jgi:acetyl-CoA carboxylase biotin carboxyl carrier protein
VRFGGRRPSPLSPDPDLIRTLAQLLSEHGLTEIEYAVGDRLIRVSRGMHPNASTATGVVVSTAPPASTPTTAPVGDATAVTSPMVGTAYLAAQPGGPAFVHLGETVEHGQPLLIIEAMKVMNEIRAPRTGRIAQILVEDAQPVEFGAVLMLIE